MDCRLDYLEKSKKFEDRLKELKSEIHALKLEEKQSGLYSHWNEVLGSFDRSLGNVCNLNSCHFFKHGVVSCGLHHILIHVLCGCY